MRAKEFILETSKPIRRSVKAAIPNMQVYPSMDNSSPYSSYRYGMALAGSPDETMATTGPTQSNLVTVAYTEGDADIINKANKIMGVKSRAITDRKSHESSTVDTVSPVANIKRNKYGV